MNIKVSYIRKLLSTVKFVAIVLRRGLHNAGWLEIIQSHFLLIPRMFKCAYVAYPSINLIMSPLDSAENPNAAT